VVPSPWQSGGPITLASDTVLELSACGAGVALARNGHTAHAEVVQIPFDGGHAVAAVSGHRPWGTPGEAGDPLDRRRQLRCVIRVSELNAVVECQNRRWWRPVRGVRAGRERRRAPPGRCGSWRYCLDVSTSVPQLSTTITHLRDVLGNQVYESLARQGEAMTTSATATYIPEAESLARKG
jgi:hypothetical protein